MIRLKEYLFYKEKSVTEFAKELLMSRSYLNQIVSGHIIPSKRLAKMIEMHTNGEVTVDQLLGDKKSSPDKKYLLVE